MPHVFSFFICSFFSLDSKISPSTYSVFKRICLSTCIQIHSRETRPTYCAAISIGLLFGKRLGTIRSLYVIKKYLDQLSTGYNLFFSTQGSGLKKSGFVVKFAGCMWTEAVQYTKRKSCRLKNIWICVDRGSDLGGLKREIFDQGLTSILFKICCYPQATIKMLMAKHGNTQNTIRRH